MFPCLLSHILQQQKSNINFLCQAPLLLIICFTRRVSKLTWDTPFCKYTFDLAHSRELKSTSDLSTNICQALLIPGGCPNRNHGLSTSNGGLSGYSLRSNRFWIRPKCFPINCLLKMCCFCLCIGGTRERSGVD